MPRAETRRTRRRAAAVTGGLVMCRCKTRCLSYNEATGRYDGEGEAVTPDTRARHRRDERLAGLLHLNMAAEAEGNVNIRNANTQEDWQRAWTTLIQAHLNALQELPAIAPNHRLEFLNNPVEHGPYVYDYALDEDEFTDSPASPNSGVHALDTMAKSNRVYLDRENTLWELQRTLQTFEQTPEVTRLRRETLDELTLLERSKAMQWETTRGSPFQGPFFNTGTCQLPTQQTLFSMEVTPTLCRSVFPKAVEAAKAN